MMHKAIEVLQVLFSISIDGMFSVISVPHLQGWASQKTAGMPSSSVVPFSGQPSEEA